MKRNFKSQSAMEYLMTYGWAILIIAIVLGALFGLGFFNSANLAPKVGSGSCQVYRPDGPGTTSFINLEGTCNNELPQYVAQFNGQSSYVNVGNIGGYASGFTVTLWINPTSQILTNVETSIIEKRGGVAGWAIGIVGTEGGTIGRVNWRTFTSSQYNIVTPSSTIVNPNNWYFIAVNQSNGGATIYVNTASYSHSITNPAVDTTNTEIGAPNGGANYFSGQIADVQIYNTSLSANEIAALYQEGIGGDPIDINNLVGWWPLNGNANDYSGNLNNGVPTSIVYTSSWTSGYSAP